jgi:hypothetical protein
MGSAPRSAKSGWGQTRPKGMSIFSPHSNSGNGGLIPPQSIMIPDAKLRCLPPDRTRPPSVSGPEESPKRIA